MFEKTRSRFALWFLLLFLPSSTRAQDIGKCTKQGWFGADCRFMCHCKSGASRCDPETGECEQDECDTGWFGTACQFRVLDIHGQGDKQLPVWLTDGDVATCNTDQQKAGIQVFLPVPTTFTWLRIRVRSSGSRDQIQVKPCPQPGSDKPAPCDQTVETPVDELVKDFHCNHKTSISCLLLQGDGIGELCSLDVSGGLNVALKQEASQSSTLDDNVADLAVDGSQTTGCSVTGSGGDKQVSWVLALRRPARIMEVVLHSKDGAAGEKELQDITVIANDGKANFTQANSKQDSETKYRLTFEKLGQTPVKQIIIEKKTGQPLTLCEVEAFGEEVCKRGHFGFDCQKQCACEGGAHTLCLAYAQSCVDGEYVDSGDDGEGGPGIQLPDVSVPDFPSVGGVPNMPNMPNMPNLPGGEVTKRIIQIVILLLLILLLLTLVQRGLAWYRRKGDQRPETNAPGPEKKPKNPQKKQKPAKKTPTATPAASGEDESGGGTTSSDLELSGAIHLSSDTVGMVISVGNEVGEDTRGFYYT